MKKIIFIYTKGKRDESTKKISNHLSSKKDFELSQVEPHQIGVFMPTTGDISIHWGKSNYTPDIFFSYYILKKGRNKKFLNLVAEVAKYKNILCIPDYLSEKKIYSSKPFQMLRFKIAQLPILSSFICLPDYLINRNNIEMIESLIHYPMVIKGDGDNGVSVWKVDNQEELLSIIELNLDKISILLIQSYLKVEQDIKVIATTNNVISSIERRSEEFLKNIAAGGSGHKITLTEFEKEIAIKVPLILGRESTGLDLLRGEGGVYISEANRFFDREIIEEITENSHIIEDIVDSVFDGLRN
jgi:hypothetical protein